MLTITKLAAQDTLQWTALPDLPGGRGWAGMYAGVSGGALICMGGANFPGQMPWQGGKKVWYDDIYVLEPGKSWAKAEQQLPRPAAYGVSVTYGNKIILAGGSNEKEHLNTVMAYEWNGKKLEQASYPSLPQPLANLGGAVLDDVMVVVGGSNSAAGGAIQKCYVLDLRRPQQGWAEITPWPGPERIFPVCAVYKGAMYMFSGETTGLNSRGEKFRHILQDGYTLRLHRTANGWTPEWKKIPVPMPRGVSAAGGTVPVLQDGRFLFWGGVDAVTAQYKDPATHPGIVRNILYYAPETETWELAGYEAAFPSRVTLPVVYWQGRWIYISGEIKPGVRTPAVIGVK